MAGNCAAVEESVPDAGAFAGPTAGGSGRSSTGAPGLAALAVAGIALAGLRKRRG